MNVKYQEIFGITMSHRAKAGFPLADIKTTSDWLKPNKDTIRLKIIAENIGSYSVNLKARFKIIHRR